jgi:chromosome segregation ATPase
MEICQLETNKKQLQTRIEGLEASTNRLTLKLKAAESDAEQTKRNADIQMRELQSRLTDSQTENEELHSQMTDLRQKLIEKEHIVETHNRRSDSKDDDASITIMNLNKQIEKYKISQEVLEGQIVSLNKKLSEADGQRHSVIQNIDKSAEQAEKTISMLRNKLVKAQNEMNVLKEQHEKEMASFTEVMQTRLETLERRQRQRNLSTSDGENVVSEQKVKELENLLKELQGERDRINETLAQVQMKYLDAINDKDQLTHEKREVDKRYRNLESQYQEVN